MPLSSDQRDAVLSALRVELASSLNAIQSGDGDQKLNLLKAWQGASAWVQGLDDNFDRRNASEDGAQAWLKDAREAERVIRGLPADANNPTLEEALSSVAKETAKDIAKGTKAVVGAAGDALGWSLSTLWGALPWQLQAGAVVLGLGLVGFIGWRVVSATRPATS